MPRANTPSADRGDPGPGGAEGAHPAGNGVRPDRSDLLPILAFLRGEIDHSATLLGDLAKRLSEALCVLATASDQDSRQSSLSDAAIALQNEDRVQQRLCDLAASLRALEQTLATGSPPGGGDLDQTIIASLRLEETRQAFAAAVGLTDVGSHPSAAVKMPPVGDVDLF